MISISLRKFVNDTNFCLLLCYVGNIRSLTARGTYNEIENFVHI